MEPACGLCPHPSAGGRLMRKKKVPGSPVIGDVFQLPRPTSRDHFRLPPPQGAEQGQEKPLGSLCQAGMSYSNSEARVQSYTQKKGSQSETRRKFNFLPQHALLRNRTLSSDLSVPTSYDQQFPSAHPTQLYPLALLSALLIIPFVSLTSPLQTPWKSRLLSPADS